MKYHAWRLGLIAVASSAIVSCSRDKNSFSNRQNSWLDAEQMAMDTAEPEPEAEIASGTYLAAGRLHEMQGALPQAVEQYQLALAGDDQNTGAMNRLAMVLARMGRYEDAQRSMERAVKLKPDAPLLRNNLGYLYLCNKNWPAAEAEFREALRLDPGFHRARVNLGLAVARQDRISEALNEFRAALPEPDAQYNLGLVLRGMQRYQEAADAFEQALTLNREFVAAQRQLEQLAPKLKAAATGTPAEAPTVELAAGDQKSTAPAVIKSNTTASMVNVESGAAPIGETTANAIHTNPHAEQAVVAANPSATVTTPALPSTTEHADVEVVRADGEAIDSEDDEFASAADESPATDVEISLEEPAAVSAEVPNTPAISAAIEPVVMPAEPVVVPAPKMQDEVIASTGGKKNAVREWSVPASQPQKVAAIADQHNDDAHVVEQPEVVAVLEGVENQPAKNAVAAVPTAQASPVASETEPTTTNTVELATEPSGLPTIAQSTPVEQPARPIVTVSADMTSDVAPLIASLADEAALANGEGLMVMINSEGVTSQEVRLAMLQPAPVKTSTVNETELHAAALTSENDNANADAYEIEGTNASESELVAGALTNGTSVATPDHTMIFRLAAGHSSGVAVDEESTTPAHMLTAMFPPSQSPTAPADSSELDSKLEYPTDLLPIDDSAYLEFMVGRCEPAAN